MLAISASRTTSHQMSSGRHRDRSTHTPAGSPISSHGSHSAAASAPTSNGVACRYTTAISGNTTSVTAVPKSLTDSPAHNSMKSRWRHSRPRRRGASSPRLIAT
jgi:hypothetical protein